MKYYVYETTCLVNGKIYIGVSSSVNPFTHTYFGGGKAVKRAFSKYGIDKFQKRILFIFENEKDAFDKEREIVNEDFIKCKDTYNLCIGGNGGRGPALCKTDESHRLSHEKASITRIGRTKDNNAGVLSQSIKMSGRTKETHDGVRRISEARRLKVGEKSSNSKLSDFDRIQIIEYRNIGMMYKDINKLYPHMSLSGIKGVVGKNKSL